MRILVPLLIFISAGYGEDVLVGYRQGKIQHQGPGERRQSVDPIWVYDYHRLLLTYRAAGLPKSDAPVLTLRPGSVGPVTPRATNPENPFVAGLPVVAVRAHDLIPDNAPHTLEVELRGRTRTAQVDQLIFTLPAGASLTVDDLQFRGGEDLFPCDGGGPVLPAGVAKLIAHGPSACAGAAATSLRGRESIRIEVAGRRGRTLWLSLMANFPGVSATAGISAFAPGQPPERWRIQESSETADMVARVRYVDGEEEDQFPALLSERRHALLNRTAALYTLTLDASRGVRSVELLDRSPHVQLALFAAGLSAGAVPPAVDEWKLPPVPAAPLPSGEPDLEGSRWYRMTASADSVRAELQVSPAPGTRTLSLVLTNRSRQPQEFQLVFPSVVVRPTDDPSDAWYVFPRQGAVIGNAEQTLEAAYSGTFPLQFVDVFAPAADRGAALIVHDTSGRGKKFTLKKTGTRMEADVEYTVRLAPGETFRPPEAQITPHNGDWREGFAAYRAWLKTWYKPAGPRPGWLRSAFWARRDYPVGGTGKLFDEERNRYTFADFIRDGQAFGGIDFIDISGWALSDKLGRVGDYPIELGGPEDLRRNIAAANKAGIPTGLYFEGYLIDKNSAVGQLSVGKWQIVDDKGSGRWWAGGSPEFFACPYAPEWQKYLAGRTSAVAREVDAGGVYLDEYGFGRQRCYATAHSHPPGVETLPGEIEMSRSVRRALDEAGMRRTILYLEETPPDAVAPYFDAAFCYNLPFAKPRLSPLKLNLWRFAFPDIRLWDMVSLGITPRQLAAEDFRLSLWHGNGLWLKGHSDTWYGEELLAFIRRAHALLKEHAVAFAGVADPLIDSPHPAVFINRFRGGGETVYTLFNASYRTVRFRFLQQERRVGPRGIEVVVTSTGAKSAE